MHKSSQGGKRDPCEMPEAASLHVEDDDVALREPVLGEFDIVEHAEHSNRIREVQLAVVQVSKPIQ